MVESSRNSHHAMVERSRNSLPSWRVPSLGRSLSSHRSRHLQKTLNNVKVTLFCGIVTFLMLRSTIGAGKFGTPVQDFNEIRQHIHGQMHLQRVLEEVQGSRKDSGRTLSFLRRKDESEDELASGKSYTLGPKISDWDEQRQIWLAAHPNFSNYVNGKPRILLLTGSQPTACESKVGDHYLLKSIKNKIDYCRLHGIEIFYNLAHLDTQMTGFWAKLPLLRKIMLSHPEVEWIWWMDSDAMYTDMVFELPIDKYKDYNIVLHGWDELVYNKKAWIGLNTGSFLLRNCQWSLDMLDAWAPMGPKGAIREEAGRLLTRTLDGRPEFEADDQSALIYLFLTQRRRWGSKVFLESSYYLHGYWAILTHKYEEMIEKYHPGLGDDRWPFVTHFVGCKPCGSSADYAAQRCLQQMERAFNFADDQILQMYGFKHKTLGSWKVKRVRNDTDRPLETTDELNLLHRTWKDSP